MAIIFRRHQRHRDDDEKKITEHITDCSVVVGEKVQPRVNVDVL